MAVVKKETKGFDYENLYNQMVDVCKGNPNIDQFELGVIAGSRSKVIATLKKVGGKLRDKKLTDMKLIEEKNNKYGNKVRTISVRNDEEREKLRKIITQMVDVVREENPEILPAGRVGGTRMKISSNKQEVLSSLSSIFNDDMKINLNGEDKSVNMNILLQYTTKDGRKKTLSLMKYIASGGNIPEKV